MRLALALLLSTAFAAQVPAQTLTGPAAFGDWRSDAPGVTRRIVPADMPAPYATRSASNSPSVADPPAGARLRVPAGFTVARFATGFDNPRMIRVAPNGDIFVAETSAGRIRLLHAADGAAAPDRTTVFASGLDAPFGIAFFPPGPEPRFVYVATLNAVVRFPYRPGTATPAGPMQTVVAQLAPSTGGHSTRDIQFSPDGATLFVSVGSASNVAAGLAPRTPEAIRAWQAVHGLGAAWDNETDRATVLAFDPDGGHRRVFATGLRNCVGLAIQPGTGIPWCSTNERDGLGDDLVPDYLTSVRSGGFYGWPWFFIGGHEDPRHKGARPDLADLVSVPDVLLQPHSAPLGMVFYARPPSGPAAFPAGYDGDAFAALHGSWNRAKRTGYKVVRVVMRDSRPTGEYQDFLTGFVLDDRTVWGRPVAVAVAHDGALLVTEDGNDSLWRVAPEPSR